MAFLFLSFLANEEEPNRPAASDTYQKKCLSVPAASVAHTHGQRHLYNLGICPKDGLFSVMLTARWPSSRCASQPERPSPSLMEATKAIKQICKQQLEQLISCLNMARLFPDNILSEVVFRPAAGRQPPASAGTR